MSIQFPGFIGPSYQLANKYATIERCLNWYLVANEAANEEKKFTLAFEGFPGNQAFCTLPVPAPFNQPNRGLLENRGLVYGVNGTVAFSIDSMARFVNLGTVANDSKPVSMGANGNGQIFIASAGLGYVIPTPATAGSLIAIPTDPVNGPFLGASYATFQDGYILVVTPNSNQFQISGTDDVPVGDATQWDASNVSIQAGQADYLQAIISSREYLRLLGFRRSQVYYNAGANALGGFPFVSYNETFIETGIAAPFSLADLGDSLVWVGQDARGQRACWRDAGFQPARISTFAVERIWQSYVKVSDAVAFPFIWNGHLMYQITFPSAYESSVRFPLGATSGPLTSATWVYDATVSQLLGRNIWYERSYQTAMGYVQGRSELFHCYAYGLHLVGSTGTDGNPGAIYQYGLSGTTKKNPQLLLRWSNDGGNTFGSEYNLPLPTVGQYNTLTYWNRCGYSRDRVFWLRYDGESECGTSTTGSQSQQAIVRDRICPHLWQNDNRVIYNKIKFETSQGVGSIDGVIPSPFPLGIVNAELDLFECAS